MKIAFVSANRETMPDAVIPIGMLYVIAACPREHETVLWDLCFESDPLDALAAQLDEYRPDLIAVGMRNIQNMDYTGIDANMEFYRSMMRVIRERSTAPVLLGGGGFSVMPIQIMEDLGAEYGIAGEAERAVPQLLEQLSRPDPELCKVESLHYREDDRVRFNGRMGEFLVMDELAAPDRSVLDDRYYTDYGIESLQTKRGCPLKCTYCTYPKIEGARGRVREPARVADEFMEIVARRPDVEHVFIVDSVFNLPIRHAKEVCRQLIARGNKTPWTCYINPTAFDAEMAELMAESGATGMEIGSDSGCDEILQTLRKGFTVEKIRNVSRLCKPVGLKDCHSFILGTTGETMDHVERTLDFLEELDPFAAILLVWVDDIEALDAGIAAERFELKEEIYARIADRASRQPRWVVPTLGVQFNKRQFRALRHAGLRGPLWQYLDMVPAM
ncbi:MAG: B12-binding domain-containing radical SAM protein [Planctomycetota bacterium]|jgi:sulfatase maturation enzyme AslB (radical SAM superfamily)